MVGIRSDVLRGRSLQGLSRRTDGVIHSFMHRNSAGFVVLVRQLSCSFRNILSNAFLGDNRDVLASRFQLLIRLPEVKRDVLRGWGLFFMMRPS